MNIFSTKTKNEDGKEGVRSVIFGEVVSVVEGTGEAEEKKVTVNIKGKAFSKATNKNEEKVVSVHYWNSDREEDIAENKNQRADFVRKLKLKPGAIVSCLVYCGDGNDTQLTGTDCKYNGYRTIKYINKNGADAVATILHGYVGSVRNVSDKMFSFSMSISIKNEAGEYEDVWVSCACCNSDYGKIADRAKKILGSGKHVICKCSEIKKKTYTDKNGVEQTGYNCFCDNFQILPKRKKEDAQADETEKATATSEPTIPAPESVTPDTKSEEIVEEPISKEELEAMGFTDEAATEVETPTDLGEVVISFGKYANSPIKLKDFVATDRKIFDFIVGKLEKGDTIPAAEKSQTDAMLAYAKQIA